MHDIPIGFMSESVGNQIRNFIREYDEGNNSRIWRAYMRIRVKIDVRKPLKPWKKIHRVQGEGSVIRFKYGRLSTFCYICGLLGHSDKFCDQLFTRKKEDISTEWSPKPRAQTRQINGGCGGERWLRDWEEKITHSDWNSSEVMAKSGGTSASLPYQEKGIPNQGNNMDYHLACQGQNVDVTEPNMEENELELSEDKKRRRTGFASPEYPEPEEMMIDPENNRNLPCRGEPTKNQ